LGTHPSLTSKTANHYYANISYNHFWKIIGTVYHDNIILDILSKGPKSIYDIDYNMMENRLERYHIALWDVCRRVNRSGSSDRKLKCIEVNDDLRKKIAINSNIKCICLNGRKAERIFNKYFNDIKVNKRAYLPSSSTACSMGFVDKCNIWKSALRSTTSITPNDKAF
jgi:hypoxanthine-DNA glycosylase